MAFDILNSYIKEKQGGGLTENENLLKGIEKMDFAFLETLNLDSQI